MGTDLKLRFLFNTLTGEVEVFEVDMDSRLPAAEHDREHDRFAAEFGRLLDRAPRVSEGLKGGGVPPAIAREVPPAETDEEKERQGPGAVRKSE